MDDLDREIEEAVRATRRRIWRGRFATIASTATFFLVAIAGTIAVFEMFSACGIHTNGTLACWGSGSQLPSAISGTFSSVSVGDAHACAIRSDGAAVCWGDTTFDQSSGCTPEIGCIWVH